jgi:hydrogenase nickel incorporation protein HypA/HybF
MHDYHAVKALIERLTDGSTELPTPVVEVRIRAGAAFSPEALQQAYEMLTPGTPLEGSALEVQDLPQERSCSACGRTWSVSREDLAGHLVVCPSCGALSPIEGSTALELIEVVG